VTWCHKGLHVVIIRFDRNDTVKAVSDRYETAKKWIGKHNETFQEMGE
jgi:hypothetical protein